MEPAPTRFYDSVPYWLGMYFFFNLGLTLFNKMVLVSFPFPYVSATTLLGFLRECRCEREHQCRADLLPL